MKNDMIKASNAYCLPSCHALSRKNSQRREDYKQYGPELRLSGSHVETHQTLNERSQVACNPLELDLPGPENQISYHQEWIGLRQIITA